MSCEIKGLPDSAIATCKAHQPQPHPSIISTMVSLPALGASFKPVGVLKYKRDSEQLLMKSGLPYTIIRPSRLTDGPYTSYDVSRKQS